MRKITSKERKAARNIYCSYCRPDKVHAIWRKSGFADHKTDFACEQHKDMIAAREVERDQLTEADYQTWMQL